MRIGVNGRFLLAERTGVQRFSLELTRSLGRIADVVLLRPRGLRDDDVPADLRPIIAREGMLSGPLWEQVELPFRAQRVGVDVLLHPANSAPRWGGPHVQVLHDLTPISRPTDFRGTYRAWVRFTHVGGARAARRVLTVSTHSAHQISDATGIPLDRIGVVTQGLGPLDAPAGPSEVARVKADFGLPERYFLGCGAGDPRKSFAFLERLFSEWAVDGAAAPEMVVVGAVMEHVHHSGKLAGSKVRYLGFVSDDDLRALYSGAAAFLFPSVEEGFGRPPLEALACGTRVIVGPYEAAPGLLEDHADQLPLEEHAWRRAIHRLLDEAPDERARRVSLGRAHAARFTWDAAATEVLDACRLAAGSATRE